MKNNVIPYLKQPACLFALCFTILLFVKTASAQEISTGNLVKIAASVDSFSANHPAEKIYLQFDKPYYAIGDTIWFKAYLLNANYLNPANNTGVCYVELDDRDNKMVIRRMLPVAKGLSWGSLPLDEKEIPEGSYTLRAYTRLMCNFGDDYIFKKTFYFFNPKVNDRLVNAHVSISNNNGTEQAHIALQFSKISREPFVLRQMELNVMDGSRSLFKKQVQTKVDGALDVDLSLKTLPKHLALAFSDTGANGSQRKMVVPVILNRPEKTDLQFMPEGGNLVAGLPAHIGFKAIGEDGSPVEISGDIYDSQQQQIISFKSEHQGMGVFDLTPLPGQSYTAKITLPGGITKIYALPPVKEHGTVLKVRAVKGTDSLAITVTGSQADGRYYLLGQSRGIICYAAIITIVNNAAKIKIPVSAFPDGIARITLLNANRQPLNERAIFINHNDFLHIDIRPDKTEYGKRDSVSVHVHVTGKNGIPVKGSFSVAITDDNQVKTDSINDENIISNLLLTSDLKGHIDDPGYYFQPDADGQIHQQLDNLLLTQGWTGYDWADIFGPQKPQLYPDERNFNVSGTVKNIFNKPIADTHVILLSRKPSFILDTVTNKDGRFLFKNLVPLDTPAYILQARNKGGRSFNIDLKVDEFKPPVFAPAENKMPWYLNSDSTIANFVKNSIIQRAEASKKFTGSGHMLKEVVINSKKIIKDSKNLNGAGNADFVIDEQELEKAGKKSFLDLLTEKVKGFREGLFGYGGYRALVDDFLYKYVCDYPDSTAYYNHEWYFVDGKPIKLIVDGVDINQIFPVGVAAFAQIKNYLKSYSAEDVKGIEVISTAKYANEYLSRYNPYNPNSGEDLITEARMHFPAVLIGPADIAFIEITTRSGGGPAMPNTPGVFLYKPLPFTLPKQFYSPRYNVTNKDTLARDYRSTIYWKPDVVTDHRGNATISFYTADRSGTYTVILEGIDGNGAIGNKRSKIKVRVK